MNKVGKSVSIAGLLVLTSMLAGCLDSSEVVFFEPGVYKGAPDPLIGNTDTAALQARIEKQMDR